MTPPQVYVQKVRDPDEDLSAALATSLSKILPEINLKGGEKVLLKPNLVNSSPASSGVTTDLRILASLVVLLQEQGIEDILIGESAIEDTGQVFQALQVAKLQRLGARVVNFDADERVTVESPLGLSLQRFRIPRAASECDLVISVAKMKTHCDASVTLSVKNLLGAISPKDRQAAHRTDIHKAIVDVYSYFCREKRVISVVDALWALDGRRGPITGRPVKMDLLLSGADPLAVDAAGVKIMGGFAGAIPHLALAEEHVLGSLDFSVQGERIEDVRRDFDIPPLLPAARSRLASYAVSHVFKKRSYLRFADRCTGCGACASSCPVGAIKIESGIAQIPDEKCIGCLVCLESCKQGALDYRMKNACAFRAARKLYRLANRF
jgi:uncharacterized protein (DUF362 family)/Pyruvate/2-oxoacid:ferredoxin oxidoreductase delta subunit